MIDGVIIQDLKRISDERGSIMHMIKNLNNDFKFGEIYFSTSYPGVIKGWHEHKKQTQNYAVIKGMVKLVMYDNRKNSRTYGEIQELFIGTKNYQLITIPPGVVNGYKNICLEEIILANCSDLAHDPSEMIRYDPFECFINYNWNLKHK